MQLEDMILVSIDDHVIEPRDMFERPRPGEVPRRRPEDRAQRRAASEAWMFQGARPGSWA